MKYKVNIKEVHNLQCEVDATSPEQARQLVSNALAAVDESIINYDLLEYSHTLPAAEWTVTENHNQI